MKKPELLVPAGNREKLEVAIAYGADAVYFGGREFSLRARAGNFSGRELQSALVYCRERRVRAYLAVNLLARESDFPPLAEFLATLRDLPPDALIVADPGVIDLCREILPAVPLHLSTQMTTMNRRSAVFWQRQGVKRINLARELSLPEVIACARQLPEIEFEVFIHGAMCMAYSGRCLLSAALTGRSANRGDCAQPCRWSYSLLEEKRPGEYLGLEEDQRGTYIFNSRDLCLLARLPELSAAGVSALKIEGRMKSAYYVAVVTRVYRQALDRLAANSAWSAAELAGWKNELTRVSHRRYTEAFFSVTQPECDFPGKMRNDFGWQNYEDSGYQRHWYYLGLVEQLLEYDPSTDSSRVELKVKERLEVGMEFEVITPEMTDFDSSVRQIWNESGDELSVAHPGTRVTARCRGRLARFQILRQPVAGVEGGT